MSNEWKLVPVEPTEEMKDAGAIECDYNSPVCADLCWDAMLAASPQPPALGGEPEVLACASFAKNGNIQCWSLQRDHASLKKLEGEGNRIVELVDSKHVTALSAQLATSEKWAREHCNRAEEFAGQIIELTDHVEARDQRITALENRDLKLALANVLPQCREYSDEDDDWFRGQGKGFNECLGEVTPLVSPLLAEIERLKDELANHDSVSKVMNAWVAEKGQMPWATAIKTLAIITKMPDEERDRLLNIDDGSTERGALIAERDTLKALLKRVIDAGVLTGVVRLEDLEAEVCEALKQDAPAAKDGAQ